MNIFLVDSSHYDWDRGPMDYAKMAAAGVVVAVHKATEGTGMRDPYLGKAAARMTAAGIRYRGAYMVPRTPGNGGNGTVADQVDFYLRYLDQQVPGWGTDPRWFHQVDLERWSDSDGVVYDAVSPGVGQQAWKMIGARTGQWVALYAPKWAYGDTLPAGAPLWSSDYGTNPVGDLEGCYAAAGGNGGDVWDPYSGRTPVIGQFGSKVTIGSQPSCDGNAYRGTVEDFARMIGAPAPTEDDMPLILAKDTTGRHWLCDGMRSRPLDDPESVEQVMYLGHTGALHLSTGPVGAEWEATQYQNVVVRLGWSAGGFGTPAGDGDAPTVEQIGDEIADRMRE